jgi:hypothetical protein
MRQETTKSVQVFAKCADGNQTKLTPKAKHHVDTFRSVRESIGSGKLSGKRTADSPLRRGMVRKRRGSVVQGSEVYYGQSELKMEAAVTTATLHLTPALDL